MLYTDLITCSLFSAVLLSSALSAKQTSCTEVMCHSNDHTLTKCITEELQSVTSVVLINDTRVSDELCRPRDGPNGTRTRTEGVHGFYDNYIWVDNSCRAMFNVCGIQDEDITCTGQECKSHDFKPNICTFEEMDRIISVGVFILLSDSSCTFYDGPPSGEYGYNDTYIWVDYGCRANFTVCGYPAYLLSSSTAASEATTMTELLTPRSTVSVSTVQTSTTKPVCSTVSVMLPTAYSYSLSMATPINVSTPPNVLHNKTKKQNVVDEDGLSVDTVIGIVFGSVAGVAVLGGGTFLFSRHKRFNSFEKEKWFICILYLEELD